jgi:hypothetical protein
VATKARVDLWNALVEWEQLTHTWQETIFEEINAKEITKQADQYTKTVLKCKKELPEGSSSVLTLERLVFQFKEAMPIV